jgi:sugar lactone lactonase YvrE
VPNSFVNDLAVDAEHGAIYISDPARGDEAALIVVEVSTGRARRVLQGHRSVVAEDVDLIVDDTPVRVLGPKGEPIAPRIGVNPIALDAHNRWLYYGPMHGTALYRVATRDLGLRVERYADRPVCDGISIDDAGNIYITDISNNGIGVIDTERRYRTLVPDARLSWPDALSFGPDGMLYIVANKLHKTARLNAGRDEARPPYYVLRVKPLAPGTVGR